MKFSVRYFICFPPQPSKVGILQHWINQGSYLWSHGHQCFYVKSESSFYICRDKLYTVWDTYLDKIGILQYVALAFF